MGENMCKFIDWQGINLQNLQTPPAAQYQKQKTKQTNNPIKKNGFLVTKANLKEI